jgi:tetratricopeptide (TPR) repeat protein
MRFGLHAGLLTLALALGGGAAAETQPLDLEGLEYSSPSGAYLAGRYASKVRDVEYAAEFFARALESDPGNPILLERAFLLDLSAGNFERAEALAQQIAAGNPRHRISQLVLGVKAMREGRWEEARTHLVNTAYTPIGELTASLLTAWTFAATGKYDEAREALAVIADNSSLANFRRFHLSLIADFLDRKSDAEQSYRETFDQAGTSLRVVEAYGNHLERTGRRDEAIKVYRHFLDTTQRNPLVEAALAGAEAGTEPPRFIASAEAGVAEVLFGIASALSDEQSIDIALVYAQLALSMLDEYPVAQTLLGEIYEDIKRYDKAVAAYDALPEDSPLRPAAELRIANNLDDLDRREEAIQRLDSLIARRPGDYEALFTRGNILRGHERWSEAAESYTRALARIDKPDKQHWTLFYFRGIAFERAGEWAKAEPDFQKALQLQPDQPAVLNYLGYSWIEKRMNLDQALGMVEKAVELRPNDGYIVDSLGWAHYQLGNYEEAVKHLERAVELRPEDPVINDHLGDAYWRVGRKLEAKFQWSHARDNKPEPKDLERIEKKLKEGLEVPAEVTPAENVKGLGRT